MNRLLRPVRLLADGIDRLAKRLGTTGIWALAIIEADVFVVLARTVR